MIGRFLGAALVVASLCVHPAAAATDAVAPAPTPTPTAAPTPAPTPTAAPTPKVSWHSDGRLTWDGVEHRRIEPKVIHRLNPQLAPGSTKVLAAGSPGTLEAWVHYEQRDGHPVHRVVLFSKVLRAPKTRIVAEGIGSSPLAEFEAHSIDQMASMTRSVIDRIEMVATAYTAGSAGGGGMTAIGRRAGFGIVAVDPRVIPIGTKLYISGYGYAVAGDTGGDIVGNRIDLGFDSLRSALLFGRRDVTVYRLK